LIILKDVISHGITLTVYDLTHPKQNVMFHYSYHPSTFISHQKTYTCDSWSEYSNNWDLFDFCSTEFWIPHIQFRDGRTHIMISQNKMHRKHGSCSLQHPSAHKTYRKKKAIISSHAQFFLISFYYMTSGLLHREEHEFWVSEIKVIRRIFELTKEVIGLWMNYLIKRFTIYILHLILLGQLT
jgi:hypothetical protein